MQPNISEQKIGNIRPFFPVKVNFKENIRNGVQKMQFYGVPLLRGEYPPPPQTFSFKIWKFQGNITPLDII